MDAQEIENKEVERETQSSMRACAFVFTIMGVMVLVGLAFYLRHLRSLHP